MLKGCTSSNWAFPFPKICFLKGSLLHPIFQSCHLWSYLSQDHQGGYVSEDFGDWSHSSVSLQAQYLDQSSARIPNQTSNYQVSANQTFENKSMCLVTWSTAFAVLALVHVSKLHREDNLDHPKTQTGSKLNEKKTAHSRIIIYNDLISIYSSVCLYTILHLLLLALFRGEPYPHPTPSSRQQHDHAHFIWQVLLGLASFKRTIIITGPSAYDVLHFLSLSDSETTNIELLKTTRNSLEVKKSTLKHNQIGGVSESHHARVTSGTGIPW